MGEPREADATGRAAVSNNARPQVATPHCATTRAEVTVIAVALIAVGVIVGVIGCAAVFYVMFKDVFR